MSNVVSLEDFTPGQRYDETPWTHARIEESATRDGAYVELETIELDPVDTDPENPAAWSFTTSLATLSAGWYRVVFLDASLNEQAAEPVYFPGGSGAEYRPVLADIASLLWARSKDVDGNYGTFSDDTRPTGTQVELLITQALNDVAMRVGDAVPPALWPAAGSVVALRTAQLVELSYFPEQTDGDAVIYQTLRLSYEEQLAKLVIAVQLRMVFSEPVEEVA